MNLSKKMLKLENGFFDNVNKAGVKIFIKGCGKAVYSVVALRCQNLSDRAWVRITQMFDDSKYNPSRRTVQIIRVISNEHLSYFKCIQNVHTEL